MQAGDGMAKKADIPRQAIKSALELAASRGWNRTSLGDIAADAKVPLAELRKIFPSKAAILDAFSAQIDAEVLAAPDPDMADRPTPERLFDVLMRRFDALGPYKEGVRAVVRGATCDPEALIWGSLSLRHSMTWMLEAAGLNAAGLSGRMRVKGLALIYLAAMSVWFRDDTEDMAQTMAAFDRQLKRVDRIMGVVCRMQRPRTNAPEPSEAAAEAG